MKLAASHHLSKTLAILSLAACASLSTPAIAGTPDSKTPEITPAAPEPWIHALLQLDFSDHYITPRGLDVENRGLIFQPLFLIFWDVYSDKTGFLQDITLTTGVWSSFHSRESGANPGHWNEFDPIGGVAFKFADNWKFEVNYTAFDSMVDSYPTSQHLELKLDFDDSKLLGPFALHPYIAYWNELENKATVTFNPATSAGGYYFTFGIDPSLKLGPVKVEFPTFINIVSNSFYQKFDGTGGGSGLAVFSSEVKFSVPLSFVPKDLGFWSLYAGLKYYHLNNTGLLDGNDVLTAHEHSKDLWQIHGGVSIFF